MVATTTTTTTTTKTKLQKSFYLIFAITNIVIAINRINKLPDE